MVIAYWLIGKEIVQEIQGGTKRATYGKQVIAQLSEQLTVKYSSGFSVANLRNFRQFYETYPDRLIHYPVGSELDLKKNHYRESSEHTNVRTDAKKPGSAGDAASRTAAGGDAPTSR
jgi:hypothetical protein